MTTLTYSFCGAAIVALVATGTAAAQSPGGSFSNNVSKVTIQHPPRVALKGITKVAVIEYPGECGAELTDRLMSLLRESSKIELIERSQLGALLDEQNLQATGRIDAATAAKLGQLVGPAGIIVGRVTRCETEVKNNLVDRDERTGAIYRYVSRTRVSLSASFRFVEVRTGTTIIAKTFDGLGEMTNSSRVGQPEPPDRQTVTSLAYRNWLDQVSPLILPWPELVEFRVHTKDPNKQDWGLKSGSEAMKRGRFDEAVERFKTGLAAHETETSDDAAKYIPQLYWNLGIALTYAGEPLEGIKYLRKSDETRPDRSKADTGIENAIAKSREIDRTQREFAAQQEDRVGITVGAERPSIPKTTEVTRVAETAPAPPLAAPKAATIPSSQPRTVLVKQPVAATPKAVASSASTTMTNAQLNAELNKYPDKSEKLTILKALSLQKKITIQQYNEKFSLINQSR